MFSADMLTNKLTASIWVFHQQSTRKFLIIRLQGSSQRPRKSVSVSYHAALEPLQYLHTVFPWNKLYNNNNYYYYYFLLLLRFASCLFLLCVSVTSFRPWHNLSVSLWLTYSDNTKKSKYVPLSRHAETDGVGARWQSAVSYTLRPHNFRESGPVSLCRRLGEP